MALREEFETQSSGNTGAINQMYEGMRQAQLAQLQEAHQQDLSNRQAALDQIGRNYQTASNDLAVQYERNRRNLNQQAAANGLNTGAGSQQALSLQSVFNRDYGALRGREAADLAEANRGIADAQAAYGRKVAATNANLDYQRAAAMLDEQNRQRSEQLQNAQTLASYGDFSLYAMLYGQEAADNMRKVWVAQNPQLAYNTGAISAEEYYSMTGKYAPGQTPAPVYAGPAVRPTITPSPGVVKPGLGPQKDVAATQAQSLYREFLRSQGMLGGGGAGGKNMDAVQ